MSAFAQEVHAPAVPLLDAMPELIENLDPEQVRSACRWVTAPVIALAPGGCHHAELLAGGRQPFAAIVVSGLLTRHVNIGGQPALCFFGRGDVVGGAALQESALPADEKWSVALQTRLAVLDDRFLAAARRWPRLVSGLLHMVQEQNDRLMLHLAIAQQPRVEDRVLALFWHLSERFGRVTRDGVVLELAMTHEAIGELVGARRPTVSLALKELRERDVLTRRAPGRWLISLPAPGPGGSPAELSQPLYV